MSLEFYTAVIVVDDLFIERYEIKKLTFFFFYAIREKMFNRTEIILLHN
jgi:hypothetical protein